MNWTSCWRQMAVVACVTICTASDAGAFRMIQNTSAGRTSFGTRVPCDDPSGFVHWTTPSITLRLNPANQGAKAGVNSALANALGAWTGVTPAIYNLGLGGTTSAGFSTDGINTVSWGSNGGCTGGCLALTALVLASGQVIAEADVIFNNAATWNTDGNSYDVEAIAAHEVGHVLGIHHTEIVKRKDRPTMYSSYFGVGGRSLETDDSNALNCSYNRYLPSQLLAAMPARSAKAGDITLSSRLRPGGAILSYTLATDEHVKLDVFDVSGRRLVTLVDGSQSAGLHELAWDGSIDSGHGRAGVYFARIITPGGAARATVLLMD